MARPLRGGPAPAHPARPSPVACRGTSRLRTGDEHTVCQIGVFLGYAGGHDRALIDRALYLPEGWARDAARRAGAGVPVEIVFATKPELGRAMLERARRAPGWRGDSVYGADRGLRRRIEARGG